MTALLALSYLLTVASIYTAVCATRPRAVALAFLSATASLMVMVDQLKPVVSHPVGAVIMTSAIFMSYGVELAVEALARLLRTWDEIQVVLQREAAVSEIDLVLDQGIQNMFAQASGEEASDDVGWF